MPRGPAPLELPKLDLRRREEGFPASVPREEARPDPKETESKRATAQGVRASELVSEEGADDGQRRKLRTEEEEDDGKAYTRRA